MARLRFVLNILREDGRALGEAHSLSGVYLETHNRLTFAWKAEGVPATRPLHNSSVSLGADGIAVTGFEREGDDYFFQEWWLEPDQPAVTMSPALSSRSQPMAPPPKDTGAEDTRQEDKRQEDTRRETGNDLGSPVPTPDAPPADPPPADPPAVRESTPVSDAELDAALIGGETGEPDANASQDGEGDGNTDGVEGEEPLPENLVTDDELHQALAAGDNDLLGVEQDTQAPGGDATPLPNP